MRNGRVRGDRGGAPSCGDGPARNGCSSRWRARGCVGRNARGRGPRVHDGTRRQGLRRRGRLASLRMRTAARIDKLPPYLFAEMDARLAEAKARGADIISFAVGDPDLPTPPHIVEALEAGARDPSTHRYPSYTGMPEFRRSIASWY